MMSSEFWENFRHNLFKPLLLFFYMGFSVPLLKVPFEFPHVLYQGLTMYLLIAIGWKGGEELAELNPDELAHAADSCWSGFVTNFIIGIVAYLILRSCHQAAAGRRGDGRRLLRLGLGRHVRHLPRRARDRQHRVRGLHAGHAGRHGDARLPGGAVPGLAAARTRDGCARQHARRSRDTIRALPERGRRKRQWRARIARAMAHGHADAVMQVAEA